MVIKIADDNLPVHNKNLYVYVSYSDEYPDAEKNDGVFTSGKIKITPPKGEGKFSMEYCSFAILSKLHCKLSVGYYFNKDPPVYLSMEKEEQFYPRNQFSKKGNAAFHRMITQIAKTNQVKQPKKISNKIEQIKYKVEEIIGTSENYTKFKELTSDILSSRFNRYLEHRNQAEQRLTKARSHYSNLPPGSSLEEYKHHMCEVKRKEKEESDRR